MVSAVLALAPIYWPAAALAFDYRISHPVVYDNLAVYFVHGNGTGMAAPVTLEQASREGLVKVYESDGHPVQVENFSGRSVFIQLGDLLVGGTQDQVAGWDAILPPHSGRVTLDTFCIDPFRSVPRAGETAATFSVPGGLFPWRMAKLSMLASDSNSKAAHKIRGLGVWWSIDTVRSQLSQRLGEPMEPPMAVRWNRVDRDERGERALASRQSPWTTSLPLALRNRRLAQAQRPYVDALNAGGKGASIIGAAFVINGKLSGAEVYQSHALFERMWPKLLRAQAIEAIARKDVGRHVRPSANEVKTLLVAAQTRQARAWTFQHGRFLVRDSENAIYTEAVDRGEDWVRSNYEADDPNWIHRSYLPKLDPSATALRPDAMLVKALQTGELNGHAIESLGESQDVLFNSNPAHDRWWAIIDGPTAVTQTAGPNRIAMRSSREGTGFSGVARFVAVGIPILLFALLAGKAVWSRRQCLQPASANCDRRDEADAAAASASSASPIHGRALSLVADGMHVCRRAMGRLGRRCIAAPPAPLRDVRAGLTSSRLARPPAFARTTGPRVHRRDQQWAA
jgi:hypothetical protein